MHTILPRRFVVFGSCSWQLTKSIMMKKKPTFSYTSHSHHNHFLSHLLPSGIASSSSEIDGFFASTLRRNTHLKPGSLLESRAGFFDPQLPPKPWGFTGFQKRGCVSFSIIFRLQLSSYTFMSGRTHTLITSGFSNVGTSQLIVNMIGLYYFRTSSYGVSFKDQSKLNLLFLGAEGPVYAITLLDIFLYPKVTTYFAFIFRGIVGLGQDLLKVLEGKKSLTMASINMGGGAMVAAIAWRQIRKGRLCY
uniref:Peptidase S54 rhomboid domain-containing protein n=1 Tax=Brassica oleracea var. oleracea TaxID=109376 RepID=A0A0D3D0K3_BRAOL